LGDFNEILSNDEKNGGVPRPQACMDQFQDALESCGLGDLGFVGDKFTWRNHCRDVNGYICERLDRATGNSEWCLKFLGFRVVNGNPRHSDHRPVVVEMEGEDDGPRGKSSFRFEARWTKEDGCDDLIQEAWKRGWQDGGRSVAQVMRGVAGHLMTWSRDVVGELEQRIKKARQELEACMLAPISAVKVEEETRLCCHLEHLEEMKNIKWRQRAHAGWLKEGDRNTRFFHAFASAWKKKNRIKKLRREDGSEVEEGGGLTDYILSYFQDLFTSQGGDRMPELLAAVKPCVTPAMNECLAGEFTAMEVKAALDHIGDLKAPGPDGMPSLVYKRYWHIMGEKIVEEVLNVLRGGELPEGWNDTYVVLIPKVKEPSRIKDLRPISLCNVLYKLVYKVLTNRLKIILLDIISDNQSAFVPGRLITDNILLAYETTHFMKSRRKKGESYVAVKADMSKDYDRVEWEFL
jgi:hypothetical protein